MQKKASLFLLLGAVVLAALMVLSVHRPEYVETEHAVLVDFAALVPADGVVEVMNGLTGPPNKQFTGENAVEVVLTVQNAGLIPYSGPKHTLAPGYHWSVRCKDAEGNILFGLYVNREIQYYNPTALEDPMYYSLSEEDEAALLLKMEELFNKQNKANGRDISRPS